MKASLISIIVPIFNVEKYLAECINSICKQTYQNIQIILVDDGSTDRSGEICDEFAALDSRIIVLHQQNSGVTSARKRGLEIAEGEYVGFVDGDDYIDPNMYQALAEQLETNRADLIHSGYWEDDLKRIPYQREIIEFGRNREKFLKEAVLGAERYIMPSIWSKLFKADLIKESFKQIPDSCMYGEDFISLCISVANCDRIVLWDDAYYHYRNRSDSLTHKSDLEKLKHIFKYHDILSEIFYLNHYYENVKDEMDGLLWESLTEVMGRIASDHFQIAKYYFSNAGMLQGKKIIIYGAGIVGRDYYAQISRYPNCGIVAWMDNQPDKYYYPHIRIEKPEIINTMVFDILIIAVKNRNVADEIRGQLINRGVDNHKICWMKPEMYGMENVKDM